MFGATPVETPQRIGFFLVPNLSMVAFSSAVETLRLANWVSGKALYAWKLFSDDGKPVVASNGIAVTIDEAVSTVDFFPSVIVCGGIEVQRFESPTAFAWLRRLARRGADIGAVCTGAHVLARAGLLDGYRCTIHWENMPAFAEQFPNLEVSNELFEIDRNRFTCSGGTAALDMMLYLIARQYGRELAVAVSDELIYDHIRDHRDHQRRARRLHLGISHPKLLTVISRMEETLEAPLTLGELADGVGLSKRQLERLFRRYLDRTPTRYYLELRLSRARHLLLQTALSVLSVAVACGFVSASHFSKCYREHFGRTPREERRLIR
jgi:transcriptional regulator GlxA family with amidase domain